MQDIFRWQLPLDISEHGHRSDALTDTDTHGDQGIVPVDAVQLTSSRQRQTRPGSTQRVTDGNGATVRVHVLGIIRQAEVPGNCQGLGGKRLVQLDHIHIGQFQAGRGQNLAGGGSRAKAHDPGLHAGR